MATKLPRLVEPKKKLSRPKPPLIPANAVIDLDAVLMGANKQKTPKFGILHFSVCTFCNYRFYKARKSHAFTCINEVEDISVHSALKVFVHVISKSRRFPVFT